MTSTPLISIIIPTRNRGALVATCLDAIQSQSYKNYEVILLDDGSSVENRQLVRQILQNYDQRIQLYEIHAPSTQGSGVSVVRNKGIALAKGDYVTFCDDDDYWCRADHLQVAVTALVQRNAQAYFAGIRVADPDGNIIINKMMPNVEKTLRPAQKLADSDVYQISTAQILSYPDYAHLNITIVSKSLLDRLGGFWEYTPYCEDVDLFVRVSDATDIILFRPEICAVHNAPAKRLSQSVSNSLTLKNKRLLEISVYQHLLMVCEDKAGLYYTRISLAYLYKVISEELRAKGKKAAALYYAQCALAVYPTLKWSAYLIWLHLFFYFR